MGVRSHSLGALAGRLLFEVDVKALDPPTMVLILIIDARLGVLNLPVTFLDGNPLTLDEQTIVYLLVRCSCMLPYDAWE